ncbi:MAG TPA: glycoside hydrolase family 15 protein, partial [Minicystis sp.]|nr:glycoside hydrolase family 15 protein [Minicystis sp.]
MSCLHRRRRVAASAAAVIAALVAGAAPARAEVPVQRTFFRLASSNGRGAVMLDLAQAKLTHFREHLPATEEPLLDASGQEVWQNNQPQGVASRGLLYDAYFGLRVAGNEQWLTSTPVDLDASGYAAWAPGKTAGTGIATMVQKVGAIEVTTYAFAPMSFAHTGFVLAARVKNTGASSAAGVSMFSLHNVHLGFGRPGVMQVVGDNGETLAFDGAGHADFLEQGFAGVVVARALGAPSHHGGSTASSPAAQNPYQVVAGGGAADLPDFDGPVTDASAVSAYQWDLSTLGPGEEKWVGVAFAHHADPFSGQAAEGWLDAYVGANDAKALVQAEVAAWAAFQGALTPPASLSPDEETLLRQSAAMLAMAQSEDDANYLREWLTQDGEPRYTRFPTSAGGPPATLPATVVHHGKGQVIASLPPGEWTITWSRDMAYSVTAMSSIGMNDRARDALDFTMHAEAGRFQSWDELKPYSMPPYQVSLCRHYGFGVEETDVNDSGPNLEFDGFGLFLWAAHHYEELTHDPSFVDENWPTISTKIADVLVALVDPSTGLLRPDSSIWETHWDGRQRTWTYSNVTAVRGLCDAATLAKRVGDGARAKTYAATANALRKAIVAQLTDPSHALASNAEELAAGEGYWDAAVWEGVAMGLFDPKGVIAKATYAGLDAHLAAPAGAGWSRNDDRSDHAGSDDLSPWGSEYDSAEWVMTDLRGEVATRLIGDGARADRLLAWVRKQSLKNYLAVSETYDEGNGTYKFNAPMIGFGAGAWVL